MVAQRFAKGLQGRAKEGGVGRSRSAGGGGGGGRGGGASGGGGGGGLRDSAVAAAAEEEGVEEEEEAWRGTHRRSRGRPLKVLDVCTGSGVQVRVAT